MSITRLDLKNRILSARGLTRARADGLLDDTLLNEAVRDAQELVTMSCNLFPVRERLALVEGKYQYPVPEAFLGLRGAYFIDSSGSRLPLTQLSQESFFGGRDPNDDVALEPVYYSFPYMQQRVLQPYGMAPPEADFVELSHVTSSSIRTVTDTAINLGRTLSGRRISPGDVVFNLDDGDGSYGYVEVLDIITTKRGDTAGASTTSTQLHDAGIDFTAVTPAIEQDDIICITDSDGVVVTYAFISAGGIATNLITYEDVRGQASALASGDTYKIGKAQKIRLDSASPHRGLRGGLNNRFNVGSNTATLTGTTFTNTRVTGSGSVSGVTAEEVAVASGGSHGVVSAIGSNYLDVERWIGGVPAAGETVTVKSCDSYQVQSRPAIERVICIGPTPTTTDTGGSESLLLLSNRRPLEALADYEELEVPEEYRRPLYMAGYWMAAELTGIYGPEQLSNYQVLYERTVAPYQGNVHKTQLSVVMSPYTNRRRSFGFGRRYMGTRSGIAFNVRDQLGS